MTDWGWRQMVGIGNLAGDWASLDADALVAAALRRSGRSQFSDTSFIEPLHRLLRAYHEEAELSAFGRYAARFDVTRCLNNLLRFDAAEEADPSILARRIERPVFITGLPRSSTTFLHALLAQDFSNAVPRCWQLIYPYPWRTRFFDRDLRRICVELQFRIFGLFTPGLGGLHPLAADTPQECTDITAQVFQSLRFDSTHHIPSYQNWIDRHGHSGAFRFHRRFLQHLDAQAPGRRWILKSPDHVFALDAIRSAYPDANIIFLHRDPLSVVASCVKLTELLRRPFTRHIDRKELGRQVTSRLVASANQMTALAGADGGRILHLHYKDVVSAPMDAAAAVYRHCGFAMDDDARLRMQAWLGRPRGHRPRRRYDLTEFGVDPDSLRESFARYMEVFAVPREGVA